MEIKRSELIVTLILLILFFSSYLSISPFKTKVEGVLQKQSKPATHLSLAEFAASKYDWDLAKSEYNQAMILSRPDDESQVAGINTGFTKTEQIVEAPNLLEKEIEHWKRVLELQPNYKDSYLELAFTSYRMYEHDSARDYWKLAWEIDPNDIDVIRLGELLGVNGFKDFLE